MRDGIWAGHWYESTWRSTGFAPPSDGKTELTSPLKALAYKTRPLFTKCWHSTKSSQRVDEAHAGTLGLCVAVWMGGRVVEWSGLENLFFDCKILIIKNTNNTID